MAHGQPDRNALRAAADEVIVPRRKALQSATRADVDRRRRANYSPTSFNAIALTPASARPALAASTSLALP